MVAVSARRSVPFVRRGEWALWGIRPVTLLICCGIILIAGILSVSALAVGHLRQQALLTVADELSRFDVMLAEQGNRSLQAVDLVLEDLAEGIETDGVRSPAAFAAQMAGAPVHLMLKNKLRGLPQIAALSLVAADGRVVNMSGDAGLGAPQGLANVADSDYFRSLSARPGPDRFVGSPRPAAGGNAIGGDQHFYLARRIADPAGALIGVVVAAVPVRYFSDFYRAIALDDDSSVSLMRSDGTLLARYPQRPDALGRVFAAEPLGGMLARAAGGTLSDLSPIDGQWKIKSVQPLHDYPVSVLMTRNENRALAGWAHQAVVFGIFTLIGVVAIGLMVFLIARQFRAHAALAAIRVEKIEAERARLGAEAELLKRERLSVLGQLTATVAHELRNPLSAIRNTLFSINEIATAKGLKLDRPVARMERSIERCDHIIGDLLEYTRVRDLRRVAVAFDRWIDEVLGDQKVGADIVIVRELGAPDAMVPIDADRVRRVVINLVDNAAQALTDPQSCCQHKRITVRTQAVGGMLELAVADTGPGIPPENLARIFEPLFSTKSFGTGLGLATVKQIVTQHGGTIRIDSTPGTGTRMTVCLPLGLDAQAAA